MPPGERLTILCFVVVTDGMNDFPVPTITLPTVGTKSSGGRHAISG